MDANDAFGRALLDWARGGRTPEVLERDDGVLFDGAGPEVYLAGVRQWPAAERQALRFARGRVLDVGCGAGRVSLELQHRGVDVVALDASRAASAATSRRGVDQVVCARLSDLADRLADFDSFVLFGNNFGIFESAAGARTALTWLARHTARHARLLVESTSPHFSGAPAMDRAYVRRNREAGRDAGRVTVRYRYRGVVGEWFHWIYVSPREMRPLLRGTGWHVARVCRSGPSSPYVAVLERDGARAH